MPSSTAADDDPGDSSPSKSARKEAAPDALGGNAAPSKPQRPPTPPLLRLFSVTLCVAAALHCASARWQLLSDASHRRVAAAGSRLRLQRIALLRQQLAQQRPRLALEVKLGAQAEARRLERLRALRRALEGKQEAEYAARSTKLMRRSEWGEGGGRGDWHAVAADGSCPASVPQWDWQLLLAAALADAPRAQHEALAELQEQSRIPRAELLAIAQQYRVQ